MSEIGHLRRGSLLILGTVLLVGSICLGFYTKAVLDNGISKAEALDTVKFLRRFGHPCTNALSWDVTIAKSVMSDHETQSLTATITNKDRTAPCEEDISLTAPEFDVSPNVVTRTLIVPPSKKISLIWILDPTKLGTFALAVAFTAPSGFKQIGITVTNVFGLTIEQAQVLSYAGTFLGTFLGPVLSFTWWYTIWKKRKKKKHPRTSSPNLPPTIQAPRGPIGKLLADKRRNTKSSGSDR